MATINKTIDEINSAIDFSDDLRKLKTPSEIAEGIENLVSEVSQVIAEKDEIKDDVFYLNLSKERSAGVLTVRPANGYFATPGSIRGGGGRGRLYNGAFDSLAAAMTFARAGDTIKVLAGGYKGNVIFKQGVKVVCEEGVVFYNSQFTLNKLNGFELLGFPKLVKTDMSVTLMTLTSCKDFNIELDSIEIWRVNGTLDILFSGVRAIRSSGDLKVRSPSFTYNKQYITIDDEWSDSGNIVNLHTSSNHSRRDQGNSNNLDVQPIGVFNGATVNWYVSGEQKSDFNNNISIGYRTDPPKLMKTTLNIFSNGALFSPSTGSFLVRGDLNNSLAENEINIHGVTRHRGSEFARDGNTNTTGSKLNIFGSVYSLNADTTFESTPVEAITVTPEA